MMTCFLRISVISCILLPLLTMASASEVNIRLAILDNYRSQKFSYTHEAVSHFPIVANNYQQSFMSGIKLASYVLKKKKINLDYRLFVYNRSNNSYMQAINSVQKWNPDVIIGPRESLQFIELKNYFKNILVISPLASADKVSCLPKNFYSLSFSNKRFAKAILDYLSSHFKGRRVLGLVEKNCLPCQNMASEFNSEYAHSHKNIDYGYKSFLTTQAASINLHSYLEGYDSNTIIFLPDTSYASSLLIARITDYFKKPVVFIGGDEWGNWHDGVVGKMSASYPYKAIHITPLSLSLVKPSILRFKRVYAKFYGHPPSDAASYLAYHSVMSFISAIQNKNMGHAHMKRTILKAYEETLKLNKHWFKNKHYAVYIITPYHSRFSGSISVR